MHILVEGPAHHPVVVATMVATKLRDSVTLAGGALVGGSRAAMPEVEPRGGQSVPTALPPVQRHPARVQGQRVPGQNVLQQPHFPEA